MNKIRARVDETVTNADAAEALKPWYRQFCKRPTFNDEFLPTFNRPNVTLVDVSEAKGVERITKTGVVANGVEYPVDCIIYASGFEVGYSMASDLGLVVSAFLPATDDRVHPDADVTGPPALQTSARG
jgi:cyclohexanone monooxygenase